LSEALRGSNEEGIVVVKGAKMGRGVGLGHFCQLPPVKHEIIVEYGIHVFRSVECCGHDLPTLL